MSSLLEEYSQRPQQFQSLVPCHTEMRSDANLSGLEPPAFCSVSLHSLPKASGGFASVPVTILPLAKGEINTRSV